ncbi:hypothetical protein [Aeromonas caviae]|uniref:hypothetical protein n=1 Tax=Aeromonas caviae TaxID=648 RepID=UPI0029D740DF|nr:hypothetical protein [Aeromonas caviae]MDX7715136.1 hypothetical protein [Aeromonas caviae]
MTHKKSLNGDLRFMISTRGRDGRYGPQSKDMHLSDLINLFTTATVTEQSPSTIIFPDLTALARNMDAQIRVHFSRFQEEELAQAYDVLFNTWTQTGSIADPINRSRRWEKVMDKSLEYILLAQKRMPKPLTFENIQSDYVTEIATKGKMYCEALLFHIISRSEFDPGSLTNDITLRGYCQWLKTWVESYISPFDYKHLLSSAAVTNQAFFPVLQYLSGEKSPCDTGTHLAEKIRSSSHIQISNHIFKNISKTFEYTLTFQKFDNVCWEMVSVLWDLHYRVNRIDLFLEALENHGDNVDFSRSRETSEIMDNLLAKIEN